MEHIIKVQRNYKGDIISFETSEGRIISYRKALMETEEKLFHFSPNTYLKDGLLI